MKDTQQKILKALGQYRFVFLFYTLIALIVFGKLFFMKGAILGGDWGLPTTSAQTGNNFYSSLFAWTNMGNPFGARQISSVSIIFNSILKGLDFIGINSAVAAKAFLVFVFALAATNMNYYLRTKLIKTLIALAGGILYATTPIFFNYSLMGWVFVLLSMALLPLFVIFSERYLTGGRFKNGALAAIIFSLAALQSQSLIWYPLTLITLVIIQTKSFADFKKNSLKFLNIIALFILLNSYWLVSLLFLPDKFLFNSDLVQSTISVGTSARLSAGNILRLWGGLFNFQYGSSFPAVLTPVSFIIPLLALGAGFFYKKYREMIIFLFVLYLIPFLFFIMNRQFLASIPFSALIRDVARFAVLSSFGAVGLVAITLNSLDVKKAANRIILGVILFLLFLNAAPFWMGRLYNLNTTDYDFKFRTFEWPTEYQKLEEKLAKENDDQKALFLPFGGIVSSTIDLRFDGAYREMQDLSAGFSHVPGAIASSDKSQGTSSYLIAQIQSAVNDGDFSSLETLLQRTSVAFIVLRKDLAMPDQTRGKIEEYLRSAVESGKAENYFDEGNILAIRYKTPAREIGAYATYLEVKDITRQVVSNQFPDEVSDIMNEWDGHWVKNLALIFEATDERTGVTLEAQNKAYSNSQIDSGDTLLSFINAEDIERILIQKKLLERQWDVVSNQLDSAKKRFLTFASEQQEVDIYFKPAKDDADSTIAINGQISPAVFATENGMSVLHHVSLKQGVNSVESSGLIPVAAINSGRTVPTTTNLKIEYQKINPTKYKVTISDAPENFLIDLKESFNNYWVIYSANNPGLWHKINPDESGTDKHFVGDGYSNFFSITNNSNKHLELIIEFWPQRLFYLLSFISALTLAGLIYSIYQYERKA